MVPMVMNPSETVMHPRESPHSNSGGGGEGQRGGEERTFR